MVSRPRPPACKEKIRLTGIETRRLYRQRGNGERRSRRQISIEPPPPIPGVRGLCFPIFAVSRIFPTTGRSRGKTIKPPNATAAGDESSASVRAPWLSTPRRPGQKVDDPPRRDRCPGRVSPMRRRAPAQHSRGDCNCAARRVGSSGNSPSDPPTVASPHRRQQSKKRVNGPQTHPRRATRVPHRLARHSYRTHGPRFERRQYAWRAQKPGAGIVNAAMGGQRSRRQNSLELPPSGAGVSGLISPIPAGRRSSLTTASSRGTRINPLKRHRDGRRERPIGQRAVVIGAAESRSERRRRPTSRQMPRARIA